MGETVDVKVGRGLDFGAKVADGVGVADGNAVDVGTGVGVVVRVGTAVFVAARRAVGDGVFVGGTRVGEGVAVAGTGVDVAVTGGWVGVGGILVGAGVNVALALGMAFCTGVAGEAVGEAAKAGPAKRAAVIHAIENARSSRRRKLRPRRAEREGLYLGSMR